MSSQVFGDSSQVGKSHPRKVNNHSKIFKKWLKTNVIHKTLDQKYAQNVVLLAGPFAYKTTIHLLMTILTERRGSGGGSMGLKGPEDRWPARLDVRNADISGMLRSQCVEKRHITTSLHW